MSEGSFLVKLANYQKSAYWRFCKVIEKNHSKKSIRKKIAQIISASQVDFLGIQFTSQLDLFKNYSLLNIFQFSVPIRILQFLEYFNVNSSYPVCQIWPPVWQHCEEDFQKEFYTPQLNYIGMTWPKYKVELNALLSHTITDFQWFLHLWFHLERPNTIFNRVWWSWGHMVLLKGIVAPWK